MKSPRLGLGIVCLLFLASCAAPNHPPLPTAARVNLSRYGGKWYEVARLPNAFQRADARATAEYTPQADGSIRVRNVELRPDGSKKAIEGRATAVAGSNNARLKVKFGGLAALAPVPADGNYWIIALEPDYSVALVGTPGRKYLWLLARSPKPSPRIVARMIGRARSLGFPVENLIQLPPPPAP